jgi:hypothetical protein
MTTKSRAAWDDVVWLNVESLGSIPPPQRMLLAEEMTFNTASGMFLHLSVQSSKEPIHFANRKGRRGQLS